jgi:hypothetical protein
VDSVSRLLSSYCMKAFVLFIFNAYHKRIESVS